MSELSEIKDPVLRKKLEIMMNDPSGSVAVELTEQERDQLAGAAQAGVSAILGNNGKYCTLTKECQACCN